jgi:hypothetical protein
MKCEKLIFTGHALRRMFERSIQTNEVRTVLGSGKRILDYPEDSPLPAVLYLGFIGRRPLHVLVAVVEGESICHVITAYEPDPEKWTSDFERRR